MLRKTLFAAALAGSLGGIALAAPPVLTAPIVAAAGQSAQTAQGLVEQAQYYGLRRSYGPRRYQRPRCFWADRRVWNGWRWVVRPVRICR